MPRGSTDIPLRKRDGRFTYRRAIALEIGADEVRVELADDFHHFSVRIRHQNGEIVRARSEGLRIPWTTCGAEAGARFSRLHGLSLKPLRPQLSRDVRYSFCTHTFDMSELAVAHAADPEASLRYDIEVNLSAPDGPRQAKLHRNGIEALRWDISNFLVTSPVSMAGVELGKIVAWSRAQHFDDAQLEAIWLLQRATHISLGKLFDWKGARVASDMQQPATCHTFNPANASRARRVEDHIRDFSSLERIPLDA